MKKSREKLGQILLKEGLITEEQLDKAIEIQKKEGTRLGETLINLGIVTEKDIVINKHWACACDACRVRADTA